MQMYVYLIHFKHKLHHAGRYIGFSKCLDFRIACHGEGTGAKLIRAINQLGISLLLFVTGIERHPICWRARHVMAELQKGGMQGFAGGIRVEVQVNPPTHS